MHVALSVCMLVGIYECMFGIIWLDVTPGNFAGTICVSAIKPASILTTCENKKKKKNTEQQKHIAHNNVTTTTIKHIMEMWALLELICSNANDSLLRIFSFARISLFSQHFFSARFYLHHYLLQAGFFFFFVVLSTLLIYNACMLLPLDFRSVLAEHGVSLIFFFTTFEFS